MIAKTVAEMARFGIEARHLRPFKAAADREVGLLEQVVTPLVRQRNPESRARADEVVAGAGRAVGQAAQHAGPAGPRPRPAALTHPGSRPRADPGPGTARKVGSGAAPGDTIRRPGERRRSSG